ncbi:MAG: SWIM zinc finger family protein [Propionicimonas sp.]|uniref:SWIM zinc finger family protein n=1 Tax=Propionicimonas sp. TaxID=1955623 RepID=UPI002B214567|nr:SWIM zinc finger family protein [Propionicimonas sp.]MEA4944815.1 SWIM zinc finger family protein [Propionicimonas sp.]MEA5051829.1 SWIM zinc finger family protein [Propionicimonas sp.]
MSRRYDSPFYPASKPRTVEGGLRARSARGKIATTWWSTRFIEVLETSGMGNRLTRGRNYARRGQVLSLELDAGMVTASVQGSRSRPYRVRIGVTAYGKDQWARVEDRLAGDAWFVAQLLAGEMPPDIEKVFAELGLALFPSGSRDLSLDCSCPDWEVPCKHLAAVFYLLAEQFDDDPFAILAWRGRSRDELLARLNTASPTAAGDTGQAVPLTELLDVFYAFAGDLPQRTAAPSGTSLLDQLPPLALTVRGLSLVDALRPAYAALAPEPARATVAEG